MTTERQAVDEADQVGAAGVERAGDPELADEQEVVVRRLLPVDDAHAARSSGRRRSGRARRP